MEKNQNEHPKTLHQKLLEIQTRVSGLTKDAVGNAGQYVSGNKILGFIRPLMNEFGLLLTIDIVDATYTPYEAPTSKGVKKDMFCGLKLRFTWLDTTTGEKQVIDWAGTGANGADKSLGSALTYAERYFLLKQFHIPTDKDDVDALKTPEEEVNVQNAIVNINACADAATLQRWLSYYQQFDMIGKDKEFLKAYNLKMKGFNYATKQ